MLAFGPSLVAFAALSSGAFAADKSKGPLKVAIFSVNAASPTIHTMIESATEAAKAREIMEKVGISPERRVHDLTDSEVIQIREAIDRDYLVEGDLRREVAMNIKRLMDIGSYRGIRHRRGLPTRGQRTHTNARTKKGPRRAIAGKKKVTK